MPKTFILITALLITAGGMYLLGVFSDSPSDEVFWIDSLARKSPSPGPGQEMNRRGVAELNAGNPGAAVPLLRQAMRLEPGSPVIGRNLSIALARSANGMAAEQGEALALLEESLELWPRNPEALDGLSTIHYKAARYGAALKSALLLEELMPERADLAAYIDHLQRKIADEEGMVSESGDRFRLLYSDEKRLEYTGEIISILQTQMDALTVSLGIFPGKTIDVLLLTSDLGDRADPRNPFLEAVYDGQIRLYAGDGIGDRERFIRTVRHEMVHALLHQAAGELPGWVHEGLAQLAGEEPSEQRLSTLKRHLAREIRQGYRVDLGSLGGTFIDLDDDLRNNAYASSLLFFDHLTRVYGSGFIPRFVNEISSGMTPESALKTLTGRDFEGLIRSWSGTLAGNF